MSRELSPEREGGAYTIAEFCAAHRISRSKLYLMWAEGVGPRIIKIGTKSLISTEAAADWRRQREAATRQYGALVARDNATAA